MPTSNGNRFTVGDWLVEPDLDRICRGPESKYLRPQVMELLVYMAQRRGRLISAGELLDNLWAGKIVTSGTVYNCIAELRSAVDHDGSPQTYIETIPKRGYRLLATVGVVDDADGVSDTSFEPPFSARASWRRNQVAAVAMTITMLILAAWIATDLPVTKEIRDPQAGDPVRRLTIELPPAAHRERSREHSLLNQRPVSISSDGRTVIFHAVADAEAQFFSRSIDTLDAEPIAGTGNAATVHALSPDGRWLVFLDLTDGLVKKVPVDGGVPFTLCDPGGSVWNLAWGANGVIAIAAEGHHGLLRIPESGGVPAILTSPAPGEVHKQPAFSPDGSTLFFTIGTRGKTMRETDRVAALSLATARLEPLMTGASPQMAPDGHLLYFDDNVLWARKFDQHSLAVAGNPVAIADDVLYDNDAHYSISADGTLIYFVTAELVDRTLAWVDIAGNEEAVDLVARPYHVPRISPDGQSIAVVVGSALGGDLWLYSLTRGISTRLTFDDALETSPVWSPDGQYVFYSSNRVDDLFRVSTTGTNAIDQLTASPNYQFPDDVSPDGTKLFFSERPGDFRKIDIFELTLGDEPSIRGLLQAEQGKAFSELSPDGRWLAYASTRNGQAEIYVRPYPDLDAGRWQVSAEATHADFAWDSHGMRLFYLSKAGKMMEVSIRTEPEVIIGRPQPLFDLEPYVVYEYNFGFDWDRTRERFLMVKKPPDEALPVRNIVVVQNWPGLLDASQAH